MCACVRLSSPGGIAGGKGEERRGHRGILWVGGADGEDVVLAQAERQVAQHQRQLAHGLVVAEEEVLSQRRPATSPALPQTTPTTERLIAVSV